MSAQRVKPTMADYLNWCRLIQTTGRGLTDWEKSFVHDMECLLELRGFISDFQAHKLEQIYSQRTPL